jgi:alkylated DNA repair dioxygenase AlkB
VKLAPTGARYTLGVISIMPSDAFNLTLDLFESTPRIVALDPGAKLLRGFAQSRGMELLVAITDILRISPFRHMMTPGGPMSVAMTNCGVAGWVNRPNGLSLRFNRSRNRPKLASDAAIVRGPRGPSR